jgi:uncharacterized protein (DUF3084 family)
MFKRSICTILSVLFVLSATAYASEIQVNTYTSGHQMSSAIAMNSDGDFVITWDSYGQDGSSNGVYAQRYDSSGTALGSEFRVNTNTEFDQGTPSIAMDADGDFVIAWESFDRYRDYDIYAQRYDSSGTAQGGEFRVNTYTASTQRFSSIAMDSGGDFVIAWTSYGQDGSDQGVYAQRYDSSGTAQGSEFRVNSYTIGHQNQSSIAMDSDGDFVIAWTSDEQDGSTWGVYAQRYDSSGVAQGSEFRVNTYTAGMQGSPSVAMASDGDFVIAWKGQGPYGPHRDVYAQRYDSSGTAQGSEFRVNTYNRYEHFMPSVAMDSDDGFVVAWLNVKSDKSGYVIYVQRYDSSGKAQGSEFPVKTITAYGQGAPLIAVDSDGGFVITWTDSGQVINDYNVYMNIFSVANLTLVPDNASPDIGDNLCVDVNLTDVAGLYASSLELNYDSSVLQYQGTTEGGFVNAVADFEAYESVSGIVHVNVSRVGDNSEMNGSGTLAKSCFTVIDGSCTNTSVGLANTNLEGLDLGSTILYAQDDDLELFISCNQLIAEKDAIIAGMYTQAEIDQKDQIIADLEQAIIYKDTLIAQRDQAITSLNDTITANNQTIEDLNNEIAAIDQTIFDLQMAVDQKDHEITRLTATVAANDQTIAAQDAEITAKDQTINDMQIVIDQKVQEVTNLTATVAANDQTIAAQDAEITAKDQTINDMQTVIDQKVREVTNLTATVAANDQTIAAQDAEITAKDQTINDMQIVIDQKVQEVTNLAATVAANDQTIAAQDAEIMAKDQTINDMQATIDELNALTSSLGTGLQDSFKDPDFVIPGATIEEQINNLVDGITDLPKGCQQQMF